MIYVTGDTHGRNDIGELGEDRWPEGQTLTRDDYVVVCGDFGAIWSKHDLTDEGSLLHWWAREMPSNAEYKRCTASLEEVGWKVDYVLTHELPADLRYPALDWRYYKELASSIDPLCNYLQWVYENLDLEFLKRWYAGHYHTDKVVADKVRVLYQDVIRMDDADEGC